MRLGQKTELQLKGRTQNHKHKEWGDYVLSAIGMLGSVSPALCPCNLLAAGDTIIRLEDYFYCKMK